MKKPDTNKRLEDALSDVDPEEKEALRTMWRLSADADEIPNIRSEQVDALWQNLAKAASNQPVPPSQPLFNQDRQPIRRSKRTLTSRIWAGSALGMMLLLVGIALWLRPVVKTAPYGEQASVQLPDGSTIELNSGSSITYPRFFSDTRSVSLNGEAYFDVTESDVPFIVETFNANVQVLGTTFNVKAWPSGWQPESVVTLTSGSVRLSASTLSEEPLVMTPGQTIAVRQEGTELIESEADTDTHLLAWRKGELVFKGQKLISVLEEIERRYGINVELRVNQLLEKEVTLAYRPATSAENVLENLCHALNLQYRPISNGYELFEE